MATRVTVGTAAFSSSICFPAIVGLTLPVTPVMFPPGRARVATNPFPTGSVTPDHHDRDRACRLLGSNGILIGGHDDHIDLGADEVRRQPRKSLVLSLRDSPLDCHVPAFDVAELLQPLDKGSPEIRDAPSIICENADPRDASRLLRVSDSRRGDRARDEGSNERAPADHADTPTGRTISSAIIRM